MQDKTPTLERVASSIGLRFKNEKTKVMRINANNIKPIVQQDGELEEVKEFPYLGSFFCILMTNFQHPPLFLFTTINTQILHAFSRFHVDFTIHYLLAI